MTALVLKENLTTLISLLQRRDNKQIATPASNTVSFGNIFAEAVAEQLREEPETSSHHPQALNSSEPLITVNYQPGNANQPQPVSKGVQNKDRSRRKHQQ